MPCRDYQYEEENNQNSKKRFDELTQLLCNLCNKLKGQEIFNHILQNDKKLNDWWKNHQEEDRKEKQRLIEMKRKELIKKNALSKLSVEERKILGLKIFKK